MRVARWLVILMLTSSVLGVLCTWIDQGLAWPTEADILEPRVQQAQTHWAFQPLRAVDPPSVKAAEWVRTPIDRFIIAALEARGLRPTPAVDPGRMIRALNDDLPFDTFVRWQLAGDEIEPDNLQAAIDVENRLLWCRPPQRLEAEILRDAMLAVSGTLNLEPYGPAFKPPKPASQPSRTTARPSSA